MSITSLPARVERVEISMEDLKRLVAETTENVKQLSREMRESRERSEREMQEFKVEMRESRERSEREMQEFKVEMRESRERSEREVQDFKAEMREREERSEREHKRFRQELASITHSIGRLVEDLVGPSMPGIIELVVPCDEPAEMIGIRSVRKRADGHTQEYDVLALCGPYLMITEVKSRLRTGDIENFLHTLEQARTFMPEHADKQIIGALATFYVDESQARQAEQAGLVVLGVVDGLMRVLNQPEFTPRSF